MNEDDARVIFKQIIAGINYCHKEFGLIHRDMKLENVLLVNKGKLDIKVRLHCLIEWLCGVVLTIVL